MSESKQCAALAAQQPPAEAPDDAEVICPGCAHQFRAIPVQVQRDMLAAGFEPPFLAPPSAPVGVERLAKKIETYHWDAADKSVAAKFAAELRSLAQQPAAVDEGRRVNHYLCNCPNGRAEHAPWCDALSGQQGGEK